MILRIINNTMKTQQFGFGYARIKHPLASFATAWNLTMKWMI